MRQLHYFGFSLILLALVGGVTAHAFQDRKDPILDVTDKKYQIPYDLSEKSLGELIDLRKLYADELKLLNQTVEEKADKKKLMNALSRYDEDRTRIIEVIPKMIKDYKIQGDLKTSLQTYSETFEMIHKEFKPDGKTLDGYKRYGFRIVTAYASMLLTIMEADPKLHQSLMGDINNTKTAIGSYNAMVDKARAHVEAVNAEVKEYRLVLQLRKNIDQVNATINEHEWPS